ncbi:AfsR/SARP family transcriptional regulator [Streptomyces sp. MJM1172]|uniref:AfsR/SARP family transcriptional regulator n=1 Tax=Streptomyces sp. MJM1172 TaxID=1703926 RepID=UPI00093C96FD|nr:BTAD domain-containing putative transcriptional regulator [Streptomyces sp. MJM1172]
MDIDVLGAPRVTENGMPIVPPTPESRHVLAVLAAHPDRVVPVTVLAAELAHSTPPGHTHAALQAGVRRLRERFAEVLGPDSVRTPESVLSERSGGYFLDSGGGRSDLHEFEREAGAGYRAMSRGDHEQAARRLRRALGLWTGPALDGIPAGTWLGGRIAALDAGRVSVLGQWVEAELALGRGRELRRELALLISSQGVRERPDGTYLAALRRAEARAGSGPWFDAPQPAA